MFARLFGQSEAAAANAGRIKPRQASSGPRPLAPSSVTLDPQDIHPPRRTKPPRGAIMDRAQFDHLVTYWSAGTHKPTTATVKAALYADHLGVSLTTDAMVEEKLRAVLKNDSLLKVARMSFAEHVKAAALEALRQARAQPNLIPADGRFGVGIKAFAQELNDQLAATATTEPAMQDFIVAIGPDVIRDIAVDALRTVSHEAHLADQLKETALAITRMEQQMIDGTLPPEDSYEMRLRRDLFKGDIALYARITRAAMDQTPPGDILNPSRAAKKAEAQHHILSRIFSPCARLMRSLIGDYQNPNA